MAANRIQIKASDTNKKITIPLGQGFDELGREQLIDIYEEVELQDNINIINDYETTKYAFNNSVSGDSIYYQFEFLDQTNAYQSNFTTLGFTEFELANDANVVIKSFFKFNFYDSPDRKQQKMVFSNIMPLNNCLKGGNVPVNVTTDPLEYYTQLSNGVLPADISWKLIEPKVRLRPRPGLNENYYIQWFKKEIYMKERYFICHVNFLTLKQGK